MADTKSMLAEAAGGLMSKKLAALLASLPLIQTLPDNLQRPGLWLIGTFIVAQAASDIAEKMLAARSARKGLSERDEADVLTILRERQAYRTQRDAERKRADVAEANLATTEETSDARKAFIKQHLPDAYPDSP